MNEIIFRPSLKCEIAIDTKESDKPEGDGVNRPSKLKLDRKFEGPYFILKQNSVWYWCSKSTNFSAFFLKKIPITTPYRKPQTNSQVVIKNS